MDLPLDWYGPFGLKSIIETRPSTGRSHLDFGSCLRPHCNPRPRGRRPSASISTPTCLTAVLSHALWCCRPRSPLASHISFSKCAHGIPHRRFDHSRPGSGPVAPVRFERAFLDISMRFNCGNYAQGFRPRQGGAERNNRGIGGNQLDSADRCE
jgi:hypothetical protein